MSISITLGVFMIDGQATIEAEADFDGPAQWQQFV
jgi:hypothetical protein